MGPGAFVPFRRRRRSGFSGSSAVAGAAPAVPNTPSPTNGGDNLYFALGWQSAGATQYDVYLDTVNPPIAQVGFHIAQPSFAIPNVTGPQTWYWKVIAFNSAGSTAGPVWSFLAYGPAKLFMEVAGQRFENYFRRQDGEGYSSLTVHDTITGQANSGEVIFNKQVVGGEDIQIGLGGLDSAHILFAGEVQTPITEFDEVVANIKWPSSLIDYTYVVNKNRPFGTWTNTSATIVAQQMAAQFAPGFTTNHVQNYLPLITIAFDGSQPFMTCWQALADAITTLTAVATGSVDYSKDLHLFIGVEADAITPDPIDRFNQTLQVGTLTFTTDLSQVRTRMYGKGHAENIPCDVLINETILPIADASMYDVGGGRAIAGTTSGGAQSMQLTYLTTQLGGGGTLAGPGVQPTTAPSLSLLSGSGVPNGTPSYAYTYVTGVGQETLPSPLAVITVAPLAAPTGISPDPSAVPGSGITSGSPDYKVTFVNAAGETTPSPASGNVSVGGTVPAPLGTFGPSTPVAGFNFFPPSGTGVYQWTISMVDASGNETPTGIALSRSGCGNITSGAQAGITPLIASQTYSAYFTAMRLYRTALNGSTFGFVTQVSSASSFILDNVADGSLGAAPAPSSTFSQVAVSIPIGGTSVTGRKLYRNVSGIYKLVATVSDNTTTSVLDAVPNGSAGAAAPTVNTAALNIVQLTGVSVGGSPTSSRNIYRTPVGSTQLKLVTSLADNTTTTYQDSHSDASLGVNAPVSDTSGLTQTTGQINAGSTSVRTAGVGPFSPNGGWVINGQQVFRYSGISSNTLTGVPASGPGAITTTIPFGSQLIASPALVGINSWNGIPLAMAQGSAVAIFVQRDNLAAQAALGQLELDKNGNPTNGIREDQFVDGRYGEPLLIATLDALLAKYSLPIITMNGVTRDSKMKSGRTVPVNVVLQGIFDPAIFDPAIFDVGRGVTASFLVQDVAISQIGINDFTYPLYTFTAASSVFTLQNLLQSVQLQ